eukprot:758364-Hanusia_phi.AAC.3
MSLRMQGGRVVIPLRFCSRHARLVKEDEEARLERSMEDKRRDEMEVRKAAGANDDADEDEYSSSDDEKSNSKKKTAGEKRVERFVAVKENKLKKLQDQTKQEVVAVDGGSQ